MDGTGDSTPTTPEAQMSLSESRAGQVFNAGEQRVVLAEAPGLGGDWHYGQIAGTQDAPRHGGTNLSHEA